ncbi:CRAL-TRIO domain-containing protein [Parasitella parasitica]|nr:CRAL-TRIO domain-containing protein [Parasitella parasitica]
MNTYHKRHIENNELYRQHERTIESIHSAVQREVPHLIHEFDVSIQEVDALNDFIDDKATLFRFLRKNNYSLPTALSLLLDTIRWRIIADIDNIRIPSVADDFLNKPLVYFHKYDKAGRPILIINLEHLPKAPASIDASEYLTPLVVFVLETARLLLWDKCQERIKANVKNPMILETLVLVDFKDASSLPTDIGLLKSFVTLLRRYPGMTGTVNFINFGWMYQGLWQMCKLVLSNEAKAKVNFPKLKDLTELIEQQDIVIDLGGLDTYQWDLATDDYYAKYRQELLPTPAISRRSSSSTIYYDTHTSPLLSMKSTGEKIARPPSSFSLYNTPLASLSPVASHTNLASVAKAYSNLSLQSKLGNSMPPRFRTTLKQLGDMMTTSASSQFEEGVPSWILSEKLQAVQNSSNNGSNSKRSSSWVLKLMSKFETTARYVTLKLIKKLIRYRGTVYWMVACILLRNGVQELLQHVFLIMMEIVLKPTAGNAVGMRGLLRLTTGQMTL